MAKWKLERIKDLIFNKEAKEGRRVTFDEVAAATELSWATIWRYANGKAIRPDPANIAAIARFFGVETAYFVENNNGAADKR